MEEDSDPTGDAFLPSGTFSSAHTAASQALPRFSFKRQDAFQNIQRTESLASPLHPQPTRSHGFSQLSIQAGSSLASGLDLRRVQADVKRSRLVLVPKGNQGLHGEGREGAGAQDEAKLEELPRGAHTSTLTMPARNIHSAASDSGLTEAPSGPEYASHPLANMLSPAMGFDQHAPRKSLHQRLGVPQSQDTSSHVHVKQTHPMDDARSSIVSMAPGASRNEESFPLVHSRSASVVSSAFGRLGQEDDISSIMMRGAADIRNAKFEAEEQRREISFLQSQLSSLKKDKEDALQRLKAVKEAAKQALDTSSKNLESFRASMDVLRGQSQESFAFAAQAKSSLIDVQALRNTASEAIKSITPLLDEEGNLFKVTETKGIIDDLQLECRKSQQVADLLRDRLQSVGGELIDAKSRVVELESIQAADREALRVSSSSLSSTTDQVVDLAGRLKQQQGELYDVLADLADTRAKLEASMERITGLEDTINQKNSDLEMLHAIEQEKAKLSAMVDERNGRISVLEPLREQLAALHAKFSAQETEMHSLEITLLARQDAINELQIRIEQKEAHIQSDHAEMQKLREALGASEAREQSCKRELVQGTNETKTLRDKLQDVESLLEDARRKAELCNEKLHQANAHSKILEERFEDQSVTLRITKEANGDYQERLIETEAKFARELASAEGRFNCEIALLQEQKASMQSKITDLEANICLQRDAAVATSAEHEKGLHEQEETHRSLWVQQEKRAVDAEQELQSSRAAVHSLEERLNSASMEVQSLKDELKKAKLPSSTHQAEVDAVRAQLVEVKSQNEQLAARAKTIEMRYRTCDLNDEEKTFITTLVRTSQSVLEQELIAKGNDLRRRDNTLKELNAKINLLESALTKHLKPKIITSAIGGGDNVSLIDPSFWMSSERSSSAPLADLGEQNQAPDRDAPTTITVSAKPTPAPFRPPNRTGPHPPVVPPRGNTPVQLLHPAVVKVTPAGPKLAPPKALLPVTGHPVMPRAEGQQLASNKATFSRLATDCSDEIIDFDHDKSRPASPAILGKRTRASSPLTPLGAQVPSKGGKRTLRTAQRTGTRKKPEAQKDTHTAEPSEPPAMQTRTRRRR